MTANDTRLATQLVKCSFLADALLTSGQRTDGELIDACLSTSTSLWRGALTSAQSEVVQRAISAWLHRPFGSEGAATSAVVGLGSYDMARIDKLALPDNAELRGLCDVTWRLLDRRGHLGTQDLMDFESQHLTSEIIDEISALISKRVLAQAIYTAAGRDLYAA